MDEGDALWGEITEAAAAIALDEESLRTRFRDWSWGLSPEEASPGELRGFRSMVDDLVETHSSRRFSIEPPTTMWLEWTAGDLGPDWVNVRARGLSQPISVRLALVRGRPRVVGLHIDNGREITSDTLREIRMREIVDTFLARWTPEGPDLQGVRPQDHEGAWEGWRHLHEFVQALDVVDDTSATAKQGTPPTDAALNRFAQVYLAELTTRPRGAMSRAAAAMPIARSTAYRWMDLCRERSLLPPTREDETR